MAYFSSVYFAAIFILIRQVRLVQTISHWEKIWRYHAFKHHNANYTYSKEVQISVLDYEAFGNVSYIQYKIPSFIYYNEALLSLRIHQSGMSWPNDETSGHLHIQQLAPSKRVAVIWLLNSLQICNGKLNAPPSLDMYLSASLVFWTVTIYHMLCDYLLWYRVYDVDPKLA